MKLHFLFIYPLLYIAGNLIAMAPHQNKRLGKSKDTAIPRRPLVIVTKADSDRKLFTEFLRIIRENEVQAFQMTLPTILTNELLQRLDDGKNALEIALEQKKYNPVIIKSLIESGIQLEPALPLARNLATQNSTFRRDMYPLFKDPKAEDLGLIVSQTPESSPLEIPQTNLEQNFQNDPAVSQTVLAPTAITEEHHMVTPGNPAIRFQATATINTEANADDSKATSEQSTNREKQTLQQWMKKHRIPVLISLTSSIGIATYLIKKYVQKKQEHAK